MGFISLLPFTGYVDVCLLYYFFFSTYKKTKACLEIMELLKKYFSDFTPEQEKQFAALKGLYEEWNSQINVISRKDMDQFYLHHVLHSLAIATEFELKDGMKIMDLGSGGGFPGVPLAILFPEVKFHLV